MSRKKPDACSECPYASTGGGFVPPDAITDDTELVVYGEAPGGEEEAQGRGFVGPSGRLLRGILQRSTGLNPWEGPSVAARNAVLCHPPGNKFPAAPVAETCLLTHGHGPVDGVATLITGSHAIESLTGYPLKVLSARGSLLPLRNGGWGVATIHPAYLLRGGGQGTEKGKGMDDLQPLLSIDAKRALSKIEPQIPRVYVRPPARVREAWRQAQANLVSIDIEGKGEAIHLVGVGWTPHEAWVMPWNEDTKEDITALLGELCSEATPIFHNASYDVPELEVAGVPRGTLTRWIDTIVTAALLNPTVKKGLEAQVLTWVPGTVTWKGLVDHKQGYEFEGGHVKHFRNLWTEVLTRLGRRVPATSYQWYCFYNGLDVAWTYALAQQHQEALGARKPYYTDVLQPLQNPLLRMGERGIPVDTNRMAHHRAACSRLERMAKGILTQAFKHTAEQKVIEHEEEVVKHIRAREKLREEGTHKYPLAKELSGARQKLKWWLTVQTEGFNVDSTPQRQILLRDHLGLPLVVPKGKKQPATDEKSILKLLSRVVRGTIDTPEYKKSGVPQEEVERILRAMIAGKKWATWRRNFLSTETHPVFLGRPRMETQYHLHRTDTGRLSSGVDTSDQDKEGAKEKIQQIQNIPKKLRDIFEADKGFTMIGADWAAIEWCLVMYFADKVPGEFIAKWSPGTASEKKWDTWYREHPDEVLTRFQARWWGKLLDDFQTGKLDPHRYLASKAYEKAESDVLGRERSSCKPYTHGYSFDGAPPTLAASVMHPSKVGIHVCKAHDAAFTARPWKDYTIEMARQQRRIETPLGWRRYFWGLNPKPSDVLASLVQGTAACLMKWVLAQIWKQKLPGEHWEILTTTHDSLLLHVPTNEVEFASGWLRQQMEQPIPWLDGRTWRADVSQGQTWRDAA